MKKTIILLAAIVCSPIAYALSCANDDNGNDFTELSEIKTCDGSLCPINKTECITNRETSQCIQISKRFNMWQCPLTNFTYLDQQFCLDKCYTESTATCPLGSQYACQNATADNTKSYCSNKVCTDIIRPTVETTDFNGNWHQNDGDLNNCLGQIYVFSGRPMQCKKPGTQSAWKNCCKNQGDSIYFDSQGSSVESELTSTTLLVTLKAAGAAIQATNAAIQAGATAAQASQAGANAATNALQSGFDPSSLAIAVAVALIMDFIANACDQMDMETGMLASSGFCIATGEYCKEKWKWIGCVQKNKTYCCFNSKLARIFHEQGRRQLKSFAGNNGFGTPNAPNCRGFTPEEFQSLDFSKIDLSEYVGDLKLRSTTIIGNQVEQKANEYIDKTDPN